MNAVILVSVAMLCWAAIELIGAFARVSPYQVVWTRYGVHLILMLAIFGPRYRMKLFRSVHLPRQIGRSLLMFGMPVCFIWSWQRIGVADSQAIFWLSPLLLVAVAGLIGHSVGGIRTVAATLVGFLGALLVYRPDHAVFHHAFVFAFGTALCFAFYLLMTSIMKDEFILAKLFHTALWVFGSLTFALPFFWQAPTLSGLASMTAIGVLGWCGLAALDRAIELAPPACLAPVFYTQVLWNILLGALFEHHLPKAHTLAGGLLVAIGIASTPWWVRDLKGKPLLVSQ